MNAPARLAAFAVAAAAAFGIGFGIGEAAGPFEDAPAQHDAPEHERVDVPADPDGWHDSSAEEQE